MSNFVEKDKRSAAKWADTALRNSNAVIIDSETTGLRGEVIELAIIDMSGETLFNKRFKPLMQVEAKAVAIHGLSKAVLSKEGIFKDSYDEIKKIIGGASGVFIYNSQFDQGRIDETCSLYSLDKIHFTPDCVMLVYSQFVGSWNAYRQGYKWQKLPGGDHSALGDCLAALEVIKKMAEHPPF